MMHKFFLWFVSFFGMLSVFGIYLGYLHLVSAPLCFFVILFCGVGSFFVVKRVKGVEIKYSREIALILLLLLLLDVYVSLPYLVYPHSYVDFGLNVAQGRLITDMHGFPSFVHLYPNVYYGVFAIFNSIVLHAYTVSSVIAIIMQVMTAFAVFLVGKEIFDEKVGLVASFLYGFSLVNIMLLEQGYLTQNFATFFFASSMYLVIMCSRNKSYGIPLVLSLVALMSYPHYFAIMFLAMLIYFRSSLGYVLAAFGLLLFEVIGLVVYYATHTQVLTHSFVMTGGILVPNVFVLSVFLLASFGLFNVAREDKNSKILYFVYIIGGVISIFLLLFLVNKYVYTWRVPNVRQLYIVIKLMYLFLVPVSVIAAVFVRRYIYRFPKIVLLFAVLYFAFFVNYSFILNQKDNLPTELYFSSEFLSQLYQNNSVGFDRNVLQHTWVQPGIYKTLYGAPDNYTQFSVCELGFLLQSDLGKDKNKDTFRAGSGINISYTDNAVDYFVTKRVILGQEVFYSVGDLRVYDMSS